MKELAEIISDVLLRRWNIEYPMDTDNNYERVGVTLKDAFTSDIRKAMQNDAESYRAAQHKAVTELQKHISEHPPL